MTDALAGFLLPHMRPILYILISARSFVFCGCILHQCIKIFAETIFKGITFLLLSIVPMHAQCWQKYRLRARV